jgi:hypothetical protein
MGSLGVKWFLSPSVPAAAARRVDRLELFEEFQVEHCAGGEQRHDLCGW